MCVCVCVCLFVFGKIPRIRENRGHIIDCKGKGNPDIYPAARRENIPYSPNIFPLGVILFPPDALCVCVCTCVTKGDFFLNLYLAKLKCVLAGVSGVCFCVSCIYSIYIHTRVCVCCVVCVCVVWCVCVCVCVCVCDACIWVWCQVFPPTVHHSLFFSPSSLKKAAGGSFHWNADLPWPRPESSGCLYWPENFRVWNILRLTATIVSVSSNSVFYTFVVYRFNLLILNPNLFFTNLIYVLSMYISP